MERSYPPSIGGLRSGTSFMPPSLLHRCPSLLAVVLAGLASALGFAADTTDTTHHLFVGVRLFVPYEGDMAPVRKMNGNRLTIETADGTRHELNQGSGFSWQMHPKVSRNQLTVGKLKTERIFSPQADPRRAWIGRQTGLINYQADRQDAADQSLREMDQRMAAADRAANDPYAPQEQTFAESAEGIQAAALAQVASAAQSMEMATDNSTFHELQDDELAAKEFDAIQLVFEISAAESVAEAYAVVILRIRHDGRLSDVTFQHNLGSIGPRPHRVSITKSGLAPGYELLDTRVYVFNHGEEIATNLSEKRFDLSVEDAYHYLLLDHAANHRHDTVPAQPVWSLAPPELAAAANPGIFDLNVTAQIDTDGSLLDLTAAGGAGIIPAHIRAIVDQVTFLPALANGQPITGSVTFNLVDYFKLR